MTRIVGGRWSGRRLQAPAGGATRPTAEKVRAAVANALQAAGRLEGAAVLDLFAGSGAVGLELASRGAASVVLVEKARPAQAAIRANIADLAATEASLVAADAVAFSASPGGAFDVVVADPPYALPAVELAGILAALHAGGRLAADAVIVVERAWRDGPFPFPEGLAADRSRRYGDTIVCYGHAL